jgi:uncharacterized C2H2 Zn-finger protein
MKSSESSTTSMADKKRLEMISPKSVKSEGNCAELQGSNFIRCFYCTKTNFMSLDQLTHHINLMHGHKLLKEHRKTRSEHESSSHSHHNHYLSCEFCLMKFSSSEKLIKHINAVHGDRMRASDDKQALSEQSNDGSKKYDGDEQPTDLSQRIAAKKIKIESFAAMPKQQPQQQQHFDQPPSIRTPGTPDVFLCNQCNASLPSFELFRLHLKNHLEENYGKNFI